MDKEFNITGVCNPEMHYMVDLSQKIKEIFPLVEKGRYFTINRPRQYGKTTIFFRLFRFLKEKEDYFPIKLSFEGMGGESFKSEENFVEDFLSALKRFLVINQKPEFADFLEKGKEIQRLTQLGTFLSDFLIHLDKKVVLMIDEVDRSSNNDLFLDFLGLLRDKFLLRNEGQGITFHSVILAGVHDVKSLQQKIRHPQESKKLNSPWNIAADFDVDLNFSPKEIATMLESYIQDKQVIMETTEISEQLFYYTSGYPFLVSKLCKIIDEKLLTEDLKWNLSMLKQAVQILLKEQNTNFESLVTKLENNEDLAQVTRELVLEGLQKSYRHQNLLIGLGTLYGIFRNDNGILAIHNKIYEHLIYEYFSSKLETSIKTDDYTYQQNFIRSDGTLDFENVLLKFQQFMREQYSKKDEGFLERNGRLLFLTFLKPILNGKGFDFKEAETSEEKRLDVLDCKNRLNGE